MKNNAHLKNLSSWVESLIKDFVNHSPENTLKNAANEKAWDEPLVGFASGSDQLFQDFKNYVGEFHWTPAEIFTKTFPAWQGCPEDLTVISWILPQTEKTKADNRRETTYPAERWARARIFGEEVNVKLRQHVVAKLQEKGILAVAPMLSPFWEQKISPRFGYASTWSERHAAYAAGLGTFGLSDGLITPKGKAMRCGSVVANIKIPPTPRVYTDHHAYCLFFSKRICGKCIKRCPAQAITEKGHDKVKCRNYMHPQIEEYVQKNFGFSGYGCGLCQTGVPCESGIPLTDA